MKNFQFVVLGTPKPKGSWRALPNGRLIPDNKGSKVYEQTIALKARHLFGANPVAERGVKLDISCFLNRPPSHMGTGRNAGKPKASAPPQPTRLRTGDVDKIARAILDAMTGVVYKDDSQVIDLHIKKSWTSEKERTVIRVSFIGEEQAT